MEDEFASMEKCVMDGSFFSLKILIVEDQPSSCEILRHMLAEIGIHDVTEAPDGRTGIYMMERGFDFVLCDWNMPMMNGIEFLKHVRTNGDETPILMVTGRSDQNSVVEAQKYGVSGYLRKPYTAAQIEAKLRVILASANVHWH